MRSIIGSWQQGPPAGTIGGARAPFARIDAERAAVIGAFAGISAAYVYVAASRSAADHFWMDEVLAVFAARQATLSGVWHVIWSGTDFSPPTYHFLLHGIVKAFGHEHDRLLWRLPSILAVYGAACCTFLLLMRAQLGRAACVLGFGMVLAFALFAYAIQVRQYGLLALGLAAALFLWSGLDEPRFAKARLGGLWLVLAGCLCLHFYGVVQVAAVGTAELAYAISRRRVRIPVWTVLLLTVPVEAALYPLASHLAMFNQGDNLAPEYYATPTLGALLKAEYGVVAGGPFGLALLLMAALMIGVAQLRRPWRPRIPRSGSVESAPAPRDLHFVMIALGALPFVAFAFSLFATHSFSSRYMAGAALLPAIAVPYALDRLLSWRTASLALVPLIVAPLVLHTPTAHGIPDALAVVDATKPPLPIVVGEGLLYIELMEAAAPPTRARLFYLTRPAGLVSPDPTNENEVTRLAGLRSDYLVDDTNAFLAAHKDFYVLARPKVSIDTTTPLLIQRGLLEPARDAGNGIQLFRAAVPDHAQRGEAER